MNKFFKSCIGSELIGNYDDINLFKISVYSISKPTLYKLYINEDFLSINGEKSSIDGIFLYEKDARNIIKKIVNKYPVILEFIEHKQIDMENFLIPKISFLDKLKSPRNSLFPSPRNSPFPSPKNSPFPSPKNSPLSSPKKNFKKVRFQ